MMGHQECTEQLIKYIILMENSSTQLIENLIGIRNDLELIIENSSIFFTDFINKILLNIKFLSYDVRNRYYNTKFISDIHENSSRKEKRQEMRLQKPSKKIISFETSNKEIFNHSTKEIGEVKSKILEVENIINLNIASEKTLEVENKKVDLEIQSQIWEAITQKLNQNLREIDSDLEEIIRLD